MALLPEQKIPSLSLPESNVLGARLDQAVRRSMDRTRGGAKGLEQLPPPRARFPDSPDGHGARSPTPVKRFDAAQAGPFKVKITPRQHGVLQGMPQNQVGAGNFAKIRIHAGYNLIRGAIVMNRQQRGRGLVVAGSRHIQVSPFLRIRRVPQTPQEVSGIGGLQLLPFERFPIQLDQVFDTLIPGSRSVSIARLSLVSGDAFESCPP